ncbi:MAG: HRDC domain-containing protein [Bacteroidales bacterium]|nr:HRDC domain-containing protein [Bacteroidales bacterium]
MSQSKNPELSLARQYIEQTNQNVFLTGKAGTGKTTFLRNLTKTTSKRFVVLAPTGVAALQAGGVTLHSFFQLPFHVYLPGTVPQTKRFRKTKINLIRSLDLIIIDEISMVRADILDEIDYLLRRFRYNSYNKPFGGVQMLMIGDLSQLPPIISSEESQTLSPYYQSFYFFGSHALQQSNYITITLQHIYRQRDEKFINILNAVRDNRITPAIIQDLNARYRPDATKHVPDGFIVLCTHNNQADEINSSKLEALKTKEKTYGAEIDGDFPESIFPCNEYLTLKLDAQVMFLKNDYSPSENGKKRYYNGKIGRIKKLEDDYIVVACDEDKEDITVERFTWENIRYTIDKDTKAITEEITGTFKQFPLRLAWAVTIHKSQGLTFDNVVINSNKAFSHGQVYVALSRCRTLEGVVLTDRFDSASVILDNNISRFNYEKSLNPPNETTLHIAEQDFLIENIKEVFDFTQLNENLFELEKLTKDSLQNVFPRKAEKTLSIIETYKSEIGEVASKFLTFISHVAASDADKNAKISKIITRSCDARQYFLEKIAKINDLVFLLLDIELDNSDDNDQLHELIITVAIEKEIKFRLLSFFSEDFSSQAYLKLRNSVLVEGNSLDLTSISDKKSSKADNKDKKSKSAKTTTNDDVTDAQLFEILRQWRRTKAEDRGVPVYVILSQKGLISLANEKPLTKQEFIALKGLGKKTFDNYGEEILQIISQYLQTETF